MTDTIFESIVAIAEAMFVTNGEIGVTLAGTRSQRSEVRSQRSEVRAKDQKSAKRNAKRHF